MDVWEALETTLCPKNGARKRTTDTCPFATGDNNQFSCKSNIGELQNTRGRELPAAENIA